jgi:hypothetical protein
MSNIQRLLTWKWPVSYLVRDIVESSRKLKDVVERLAKSEIVAPCYFTVLCGPHSCVITRSPTDFRFKKWDEKTQAIIQTNQDDNCVWNGTDDNIIWSEERRKFLKGLVAKHQSGWKCLDQFKQDVLKKPVINEETIYVCCLTQNTIETRVVD